MKKEERKVGSFCPPCESAPKNEENEQKTQLCEEIAQEQKLDCTAKDAEGSAEQTAQTDTQKAAEEPKKDQPIYAQDAKTAAVKTPKKTLISGLDAAFAAGFFVIGWLFWRMQNQLGMPWFYNSGRTQNIGLFVFTLVFAAAVLLWLYFAGRRPEKESWFWFGIMLTLSAAYALPYGGDFLGIVHYLALLAAASYWVLSASGRLVAKNKTSNFVLFDLVNMAFTLPWGNFGRVFAVPGAWMQKELKKRAEQKSKGTKKHNSTLWAVIGGIMIAVLLLIIVIPMLISADAGFEALWNGIFEGIAAWFANLHMNYMIESSFVQLVFSIPTAMYLYGLVYGCVRGRRLENIEQLRDGDYGKDFRFVPRVTAATALGVLCAVYLVFIALQANYLFGAFTGRLPQGFSYAEYARRGFFELCKVAAVNLCILLGANSLCRTPRSENAVLRLMNVILSSLTLLLLTTAAAKMALYISVYGLTRKRILVSVFLVWLAAVFVGVIVMQLRRVEIVRFAAMLGAVLFTLMCLLPVGDAMKAYNDRFARQETSQVQQMQEYGDFA